MAYYVWLLLNSVIVVGTCIYIWIFRSQDSSVVIVGQVFSQLAILLFFINVNMYFIFLVIRKTKVRKIKISLAKLSRRMMKSHIWIGIMGTILIVFHGGIMLVKVGGNIGYTHTKVLSGILSILLLMITIYAGYLRHKKSSGLRRKFHYVTAFLFTFFFLLHMFLPI